MSDVMGVNYTKSINPISSNIIDTVQDNKVFSLSDSYEASGLAANSTIKMGKKLPAGAIVVGAVLSFDALGGGSSLALGDGASGTRYLADAASTSAGVRVAPDTIGGVGYVVGTATNDDIVTVTAGSGGTLTGTIKTEVLYKMNSAA